MAQQQEQPKSQDKETSSPPVPQAYAYDHPSLWESVLVKDKGGESSSNSNQTAGTDIMDGSEHKEEEEPAELPLENSATSTRKEEQAVLRAQALLEAHAKLQQKQERTGGPADDEGDRDVNTSGLTDETVDISLEEEEEEEPEAVEDVAEEQQPEEEEAEAPEDEQQAQKQNSESEETSEEEEIVTHAAPTSTTSSPPSEKNPDTDTDEESESPSDERGLNGRVGEASLKQAAPEEPPLAISLEKSLGEAFSNETTESDAKQDTRVSLPLETNKDEDTEIPMASMNENVDESGQDELKEQPSEEPKDAEEPDVKPKSTSDEIATEKAPTDGLEENKKPKENGEDELITETQNTTPEIHAVDIEDNTSAEDIIQHATTSAPKSPTDEMPHMLPQLNLSPEMMKNVPHDMVADLMSQVLAKAARKELEERRKRQQADTATTSSSPPSDATPTSDGSPTTATTSATAMSMDDPEELQKAQAKLLAQAEALAKAQAYLQAQAKALEIAQQQAIARRSASSSVVPSACHSPTPQHTTAITANTSTAIPTASTTSQDLIKQTTNTDKEEAHLTPPQIHSKDGDDKKETAASESHSPVWHQTAQPSSLEHATPIRNNGSSKNGNKNPVPASPKALELEQKVRQHTEWLQKARSDAEAKAKALMETARAEATARKQARDKARAVAEQESKARAKAEAEAKMRAKAQTDALAFAETQALVQAQVQAEKEAKARAKQQAEDKMRAKAYADAQALAFAEEKEKAEAKIRVRAEQSFKEDLSKNLSAAQQKAKAIASGKTAGATKTSKALPPPSFTPFGKSKAEEDEPRNQISLYLQVPGVVHTSEVKVELEDGVLYVSRGIMVKGVEGVRKFTRSFPFEEQVLDTSRLGATLIPANQTVDNTSVLKFTLPKLESSWQVPIRVQSASTPVQSAAKEEDEKKEEEPEMEDIDLSTALVSSLNAPHDEVSADPHSSQEDVPEDELAADAPYEETSSTATTEDPLSPSSTHSTTETDSNGYRTLNVYVPKSLSPDNVSVVYSENSVRVTGGSSDDGDKSFQHVLPVNSHQADVRQLEATLDPEQRILVIRAPLKDPEQQQQEQEQGHPAPRRIRVLKMEESADIAASGIISLFGDEMSLSSKDSQQQQQQQQQRDRTYNPLKCKIPGVKAATKFIKRQRQKRVKDEKILW